ncbi:MAG: hypothetical protein U1E81_13240 [Xanthobacteraceae bacterium]
MNSFKPPLAGGFSIFFLGGATLPQRSIEELEAGMEHQFRSGQLVRLCRSIRYGAPEGDYEIVRPLPDEGGELRYRVKSTREPHERVVKESDLELHSATG